MKGTRILRQNMQILPSKLFLVKATDNDVLNKTFCWIRCLSNIPPSPKWYFLVRISPTTCVNCSIDKYDKQHEFYSISFKINQSSMYHRRWACTCLSVLWPCLYIKIPNINLLSQESYRCLSISKEYNAIHHQHKLQKFWWKKTTHSKYEVCALIFFIILKLWISSIFLYS